MTLNPIATEWLDLACLSTIIGLGYCFLLRRTAHLAQPWRLRLAVLGEQILATNPSEARARDVRFYLDNAFSGWVMVLAAVALPFVALWSIAKYPFVEFKLKQETTPEDKRLILFFGVSAIAANPILGVIFLVELAIVAALVTVFVNPAAFVFAVQDFIRAEVALLGTRHAAAA